MSVVLDTNTTLYFLGGKLAQPLPDDDYLISVITEIELLSYPLLSPAEEQHVAAFLTTVTIIELTTEIRVATINVRRNHRLKLPDAIIAGTAVSLGLMLFTNDRRLANTLGLQASLTTIGT